MKRRLLYGTLLTVLALNILVGAQIYLHAASASEGDDPYVSLKLFTTVLERVRSEYVDNSKLSYRDLVHAALKGMLSTLDPHSEFMDPPKYQELKNDTSGEFGVRHASYSMQSSEGAVRRTRSKASISTITICIGCLETPSLQARTFGAQTCSVVGACLTLSSD